MNNCYLFNNKTAIVTTQAGFKKFIKQYSNYDKDIEIKGYPESYPSFVTLSYLYMGYHYIHASCIPLNDLKSFIDEFEVEHNV